MKEQLETGDVVKLKSGGPKMTVEAYWDNGSMGYYARTVWFTKGLLHMGTFRAAQLTVCK